MRALRWIPLIVAPAFALLATLGARPAHAMRVGYRGAVLTRQQVERLLGPALRVPGDSLATASYRVLQLSAGRVCERVRARHPFDASLSSSPQSIGFRLTRRVRPPAGSFE